MKKCDSSNNAFVHCPLIVVGMLASCCRRGIGESVSNNRHSQVVVSSVQSCSWLWCIQELHKTESHYQLIQNANSTTAARATNTKKNITKQSQLTRKHWNEKTGGQTPKRHRIFLGKLMPMTTCQETLAPRNIEHHATCRQQPEVIWELGYPRVWLYVQWQ